MGKENTDQFAYHTKRMAVAGVESIPFLFLASVFPPAAVGVYLTGGEALRQGNLAIEQFLKNPAVLHKNFRITEARKF